MKPKNTYFLNALVVTLLWFLIFCVVNLIFAKKALTRIDFTKSQKYSLSSYSRNTTTKLQNPLKITFYLSKELPGELKNLRRYSQDLFKEYQVYSQGNLEFEIVDPVEEGEKTPEKTLEGETSEKKSDFDEGYGNKITEKLVKVMAIKGIPLSIKEEFQKGKNSYYFSSIQLSYMGKKRIIEHIQSPNNLEYRLTSSVDKLISLNSSKVGFYGPGGLALNLKSPMFGALIYQIWKLHPVEELKLDRQFLFDLAPELSADFSTDKLSEALREAFQKQKQSLSAKGVIRGQGNRWILQDGEKVYSLEKDEKNKRLQVYNPNNPVPEDIDILMVFGMGKASEEALYSIDRFIQRGGKVIFLTKVFGEENQLFDVANDMYWQLPKQYRPQMINQLARNGQIHQYFERTETGLDPLLEHYGIQIEPALLTDPGSCLKIEQESYKLGWIREVKKKEELYLPEAIKILPKNSNSDFSFVNNLDNLVFIRAHSFAPSQEKNKDIQFISLMKTTDRAMAYEFKKKQVRRETPRLTGTGKPEMVEVMPSEQIRSIPRKPPFPRARNKQRHIVALVRGKFTPFFASPPWALKGPSKKEKSPGKKEGTIIVIGNTFFLQNQVQDFLKQRFRFKESPAYRFMVEIVEWLDSGENLAAIRTKHFDSHPIKELTDGEERSWKWWITLTMPFIVVLMGLLLLVSRKVKQ